MMRLSEPERQIARYEALAEDSYEREELSKNSYEREHHMRAKALSEDGAERDCRIPQNLT